MKMSDTIAAFIMDCLSSGGGVAEIQRRGLAERFSCVPSQINYVIETRFTPENGYRVESRRGGGGYIRIVRIQDDKSRMLLEVAQAIGGQLSQNEATRLIQSFLSVGLMTPREGRILMGACSDGALSKVPLPMRDHVRAAVFQCAVLSMTT